MALKMSEIARKVEQEHECIKRDMGDIERAVKREISPSDFSEWRLEMLWRLRDFRLHLLKHFDLEEEGGFMAEVLSEAPEYVNHVRRLEDEHERVIQQIDSILLKLKKMDFLKQALMTEIRALVLDLLSLIRSHEAAENELIQKVYQLDYGYPAY